MTAAARPPWPRLPRFALAFAFVLGLAAPPGPAGASTADLEFTGCASAGGQGAGECQHYLRNPAGATDDPCWCDKCRNGSAGQRHDGRSLPPGWDPAIFAGSAMECYLKRHAVAFGITCSECLRNDRPWPDGAKGPAGAAAAKDFAGRPAKETVLARLDLEKKLFRKPEEVVLAYDRHFYLATDVSGLEVRTTGGSIRRISKHEWLHLMIERAEFARREWVRNFGEPIVMRAKEPRPIAVYIPERMKDFERIGAEYFKQAGSMGLRGAVAELCEGMCLTGVTFSREECGDDHQTVVYLRHHLAHALLSVWGSLETRPKAIPAWMDEGVAHWLTKSLARYRDDVFKCMGEGGGGPSRGGGGGAFPGKDWEKEVAAFAQGTKVPPIEEFLAVSVLGDLKREDEQRAWSYVDLCLSEWRAPFVGMLADLRREKDVREAFARNLGCSPEAFDARWRDRVLGRRRSMAPTAADGAAEAEDAPGARDRRSLAAETDPRRLAAKVRQLGEIGDPKTIPFVIDVISQDLDLPRETALVRLLAVKDPACRRTLWTYGLSHPDGIVRAYTARICGRLRLDEALPRLEAQLEDGNWYARAEAAVACGAMGDARAMAGIRKIVESDPSDKARVGAMDALALLGEKSAPAVPAIARVLDAQKWQLRIAAAQALGEIASMEAVEPLVSRFETEPTGRVADEVHRALTAICRDDLGRKPENWRRWWDLEKARTGGGRPKRPPPSAGPAADAGGPRETIAEAAPYLRLYSNRVAFVCDTSESMRELFTPDPEAARTLSREYTGTDKLTICREEISQALAALDPRSSFNIITFGTRVSSFRPDPVPASPANVDQGCRFLRAQSAAGQTDYYDALKTALDIGDEPDTNADFRPTADTITFLTDGEPTKGDIVDGDVILEWYTGVNRYARVRTHTMTFGVVSVDVRLLRAMAERNGGTFTLVPDRKGPGK